ERLKKGGAFFTRKVVDATGLKLPLLFTYKRRRCFEQFGNSKKMVDATGLKTSRLITCTEWRCFFYKKVVDATGLKASRLIT
ncbi:MAG: hypothetical protein ACI8Z9_001653, partial [Paraglaciecola sp.]